MEEIYYNGKQIFISVHAIKRARQRNIAFPDKVYKTIQCGSIERFGKNYIKFISKSKKPIICIGEDLGQIIVIKTIERGN